MLCYTHPHAFSFIITQICSLCTYLNLNSEHISKLTKALLTFVLSVDCVLPA